MITLPKPKNVSSLGHSADVSLWLHIGDRRIELAQTGRTELKLAEDIVVAPGPARVEIITDGVSYCSDVIVTGRKPGSLWLEITG